MKRGLLYGLAFFLAVVCIPMTAFSGNSEIKSDSQQEQEQVSQENASQPEAAGSSDSAAAQDIFKLLLTDTGEVLELTASDYIKGVVAAEIPMTYEDEAIKAQAVAAHTYALRMRDVQGTGSDASLNGADFSDDPSKYQAYVSREEFNEMYGDKAEEYWEKLNGLVDEVIGKVMLYEEEPIAAAFHSTSSGKTESAEIVWGSAYAYLVPVDSTADQNAPTYQSETVLSFEEVSNALKTVYSDIALDGDKSTLFQIKSASDSGTITSLSVGNKELSGVQLRSILGLPSANFTVQYRAEDDSFVFTTRGLGHGVGMSQYGANQLAKEGKNYEEILTRYYTGITLSDL